MQDVLYSIFTKPMERYDYCSHLIDEEAEVQRIKMSCSRSHCKPMVETGFKPRMHPVYYIVLP